MRRRAAPVRRRPCRGADAGARRRWPRAGAAGDQRAGARGGAGRGRGGAAALGDAPAPASPARRRGRRRWTAPREGGADDLKKIKGVGPKLEELLHGLGIYHFDQIAAWTRGGDRLGGLEPRRASTGG